MGAGASGQQPRYVSLPELAKDTYAALPDGNRGKFAKALTQAASAVAAPSLRTNSLTEYFEEMYQKGGVFHHPEYLELDQDKWVWQHQATGIYVWRDAIVLTNLDQPKKAPSRVFFHYTNKLGFNNITSPAKKANEVWASLKDDPKDPNANAWWGKGIYTTPYAPHQWDDRRHLLDNNFRNMMRRDEEEYGPAYVEAQYPPRVEYCVPIIISEDCAYDVAKRQTPEMKKNGKPPGTNLQDKKLEGRSCVVLRVEKEEVDKDEEKNVLESVENAQSNLLRALKERAQNSSHLDDKLRHGDVLRHRGKYEEAEEEFEDVLAKWREQLGDKDLKTMEAASDLASVLLETGDHKRALILEAEALGARKLLLSKGHEDILESQSDLGLALKKMGHHQEAKAFLRSAWEGRSRTLGARAPETLISMNDWGRLLASMEDFEEAEQVNRRALKGLKEVLGDSHPETLTSMSNLGSLLRDILEKHKQDGTKLEDATKLRKMSEEAEDLYRHAYRGRGEVLGRKHSYTSKAASNLAVFLLRNGAQKKQRRAGKAAEERPVSKQELIDQVIAGAKEVLRKCEEKKRGKKDDRQRLQAWTDLGKFYMEMAKAAEAGSETQRECYNEAQEYLRSAWEGRNLSLGPANRKTKTARARWEAVPEKIRNENRAPDAQVEQIMSETQVEYLKGLSILLRELQRDIWTDAWQRPQRSDAEALWFHLDHLDPSKKKDPA